MNRIGILEPTLKDILQVIKPSRGDWVVRAEIIDELKQVVSTVESLRETPELGVNLHKFMPCNSNKGATVEPFGSFVSNLFTRWGDLDISVLLLNGSCIPSSGKKRRQNLLVELLKAMRQTGGWRRIQFVPNARVPILKFESGRHRISCDISIDNLYGQMKSKFLFWINQIDGRFRDMVLLVKEWAKAHKINDPKCGTFNSYSLSLLVIFHFQTCVPAILPPLRELYPGNVVDDLVGERIVAEERIKDICNANISRYMSDKRREINQSSLAELFISFLAKFSDVQSKAAELGICTFTGEWQDIRSTTRWLPKTYALFIEDPYEQPENTARAVSAGNWERISDAFQRTYRSLILANQNRNALLGVLVRPQIFSSFGTLGNPNYTVAHYQSAQQIGRAMHSPSQVQHHFQNGRQERDAKSYNGRKQRQENQTNANNLTKQRQETISANSGVKRNQSQANTLTRPNSAVHRNGQEQQVWRPKFGRK